MSRTETSEDAVEAPSGLPVAPEVTDEEGAPETTSPPLEGAPSEAGLRPGAEKPPDDEPSSLVWRSRSETSRRMVREAMEDNDFDTEMAAQQLGVSPGQLTSLLSAFEENEYEHEHGDGEAEEELRQLLQDLSGVQETARQLKAAVRKVSERVESMDRVLFSSLRGMAMMLSDIEVVINPQAEPPDKAESLQRLQKTIATVRGSL